MQTWYFAWELAVIPYVPLLIVPYMSIDLFFFMAAFLCRDERELRTFAQRVVFSIVVAAAFFLLLPLKLDWPERPPVGGWFGDFVEQSCTAPFLMEYPHNLFPSLHIALCLIVADIYARHTRGIVRVLLCTWFILIGIVHAVDLAAPSRGPCGRVDAGRVRILPFPRIRLAPSRDAERPGRLLLRRGCRDGAGAGDGGLALGRVPALARGRAGDQLPAPISDSDRGSSARPTAGCR